MALADDIQALRTHILRELTAAHDYYEDTKMAWNLVHQLIQAGHKVKIQNLVTGT